MKKSKYFVLFVAAFAFIVGITGCEVESEKHEHTFSAEWTSDAIAHWHAATCEHKTEISDKAAHTFGEWTVTNEATETHEGEKERTCSVCKYVEKETIAKLEHTHVFNPWNVIKEATITEEGEKERSCCSCGYVEKSTIPKLECTQHTFGEWIMIINPTETYNGKKERTCSFCGYVESFIIPSLEHTHDFSEKWTHDETSHWHICNNWCSQVEDKAAHQWNEVVELKKWPTCKEEGEKTYSCSICFRHKTETLPKTDHHFSSYCYQNEIEHWHLCSMCLKKESEQHQWDDGEITMSPTCKYDGKKTYTCSVCARKKEEKLPKLGHVLRWSKYSRTEHAEKCERGDYISKFEKHKWDLGKITTKSTHDTNGIKTYTCSVCNETEEEIIPAGHDFGDWTVIPATETAEGNTGRVCSTCNYYDSEAIPKISDALEKVKGATFSENQRWNPASEIFANKNISIKSLYVSRYEVTRGEYKKIIGSDPSKLKARDKDGNELNGDAVLKHPVDSVNWYEAIVYCNKLSEKEGLEPCYTIDNSTDSDKWGKVPHDSDPKWNAVECDFRANGYRLPTEEEWEYLARAGKPLGGYIYSGSNKLEEVAWSYNDCGYGNDWSQSRKVGTKNPNDLGLFDMSGNVFEWCWDSADNDDNEKLSYGYHRCRGGSMDITSLGIGGKKCYLEISTRSRYQIYAPKGIGFRVVRTVTE